MSATVYPPCTALTSCQLPDTFVAMIAPPIFPFAHEASAKLPTRARLVTVADGRPMRAVSWAISVAVATRGTGTGVGVEGGTGVGSADGTGIGAGRGPLQQMLRPDAWLGAPTKFAPAAMVAIDRTTITERISRFIMPLALSIVVVVQRSARGEAVVCQRCHSSFIGNCVRPRKCARGGRVRNHIADPGVDAGMDVRIRGSVGQNNDVSGHGICSQCVSTNGKCLRKEQDRICTVLTAADGRQARVLEHFVH
jgi:hypothetical protein